MGDFNNPLLYLISGAIILFIAIYSLIFLIRAYKAGIKIGMDKAKLKKTITSSATFTLLPSISILLGVIALSGSLGLPLPWLRLSVVGALHYETSVADIAARSIGLANGLADKITNEAFVTIALLMSVGIIWGVVCMLLFGKMYCKKLQTNPNKKSGGKSFGDDAMVAMFIGLITAYTGSYIGQAIQFAGGKFTYTGQYLQLVTFAFAAIAMMVFNYFSEKKNAQWLENFSIAGSMLVGMAAAVATNIIF